MPPKEDAQSGLFDNEWGSAKAKQLIKTMDANHAARDAFNDANDELGELFRAYVVDVGLKPGARVRIGKYVTTVTARAGGGTTMKKWSSVGRGQLKLLDS